MGLNGSPPWTSKVGTGRCLSQNKTRLRPRFVRAVDNCSNLTRSPFGLCNAPATFSRLMDRILAGLHWETCLFYLDNIIVFSSTWEEHLAWLREVFERLRHARLKLGAVKCTFAAKEVSYLGHRVTEEGLLPDPSLLAAIRDIPPPTTATEVCSFLGLAGYYQRYVKGFAAIAAPLHALTRKDAVFHWSEDCQNAFDQLKTLLTTSPITALPDFSQAFRLYTDASAAGLGAILAQVRDGKERIICCASRALNKAEKSYPVPGDCVGSRQVPSLPHGHAIRGIYGSLCTPMAKDDAHGVCAPSPLVRSSGGVRLHRASSSR